jgi:hypothetical protein
MAMAEVVEMDIVFHGVVIGNQLTFGDISGGVGGGGIKFKADRRSK